MFMLSNPVFHAFIFNETILFDPSKKVKNTKFSSKNIQVPPMLLGLNAWMFLLENLVFFTFYLDCLNGSHF